MANYLEKLKKISEQKPTEAPLKTWAMEACKESRQVHINMWVAHFPKEVAVEFRELLLKIVQPMLNTADCTMYVRNFFVRLASIQSYLAGEGPFIPPGAPSDEAALLPQGKAR